MAAVAVCVSGRCGEEVVRGGWGGVVGAARAMRAKRAARGGAVVVARTPTAGEVETKSVGKMALFDHQSSMPLGFLSAQLSE